MEKQKTLQETAKELKQYAADHPKSPASKIINLRVAQFERALKIGKDIKHC